MALETLQAVLYFVPKPATPELLELLRNAIPAVSDELYINLRPLDETNKAILSGDDDAFEEIGHRLFLQYDEKGCPRDAFDWILHVMLKDEALNGSALFLVPTLPEATKETINLVWNRLIEITTAFVIRLKPLMAAINGVDTQIGGQVVSLKRIKLGTLPLFFTPYAYLDSSFGHVLGEKLKAAGAYRVEQLPTGIVVQFVADFYCRPSHALKKSLREIYGTQSTLYKQTDVHEP